MTYSLDLDFWKPRKDEFPGPARAHIFIKTYSENDRGTKFITPDCVTIGELEFEVKRLHKELDDI